MKFFFQKLLMWSLMGLVFTSCVSKRFYMQEKSSWEIEAKRKMELNSQLKSYNDLLLDSVKALSTLREAELQKYSHEIMELKRVEGELKKEKFAIYNEYEESKNLVETLKNRSKLKEIELEQAYAQQAVLDSYIKAQNETWDELEKPLKDAFKGFDSGDIHLSREGDRLHLIIPDKLFFKSGSATVNAEAKSAITNVAQTLAGKKNIKLIVEGHTDNVPLNTSSPFRDNWQLSIARSLAVNDIMVKYVEPERLTVAGKGEFSPISSNESEAGRALNRRTEIILENQNNVGELVADMAIDVSVPDTKAKIITDPETLEKYMIREPDWRIHRLGTFNEKDLAFMIRKLAQTSYSERWKVNTGNDFFQAQVRRYRAVVIYSDKAISQVFDLVDNVEKNHITIKPQQQ